MAENVELSRSLDRATAMRAAGDLPGALQLLARIVADHGRAVTALLAYGEALEAAGEIVRAEQIARRALQSRPDCAPAHALLGRLLFRSGKAAKAEESLRAAVRAEPQSAPAHLVLAEFLAKTGRHPEALTSLEAAVAAEPQHALALHALAEARLAQRRPQEAIAVLLRAVEAAPVQWPLWQKLAFAYGEVGDFPAAVAACERVLAIDPGNIASRLGIAAALDAAGRGDERLPHLDAVLSREPGNPVARVMRAYALLSLGRFDEGWQALEARWDDPNFPEKQHPGPRWRGERIEGKRLLVSAEQGFGDVIQFARFVPRAASTGAQVTLEVQPELKPLLASLAGVARLIARGEDVGAYDVQCPIMSLPAALGVGADVAVDAPYMSPPAELAAAWGKALADRAPATRKRVGLCWAGRAQHARDAFRSCPAPALAGFRDADVTWVSLQKGPRAGDAAAAGVKVVDITGDLHTFADTAALVASLDAVVTVDTVIAHLAGAMGKPTVLMLPACVDWRWMYGRSDTPWYASVRLVRQRSPSEWGSVVAEAAVAAAG